MLAVHILQLKKNYNIIMSEATLTAHVFCVHQKALLRVSRERRSAQHHVGGCLKRIGAEVEWSFIHKTKIITRAV